MIKKISILILMIINHSNSLSATYYNQNVEFKTYIDPLYNAEISTQCKNGCLALQSLSKLKKIQFQKGTFTGGKNPSSVICQILGGLTYFVTSKKNKQQKSFCRFDDRSYVYTGDFYHVLPP